jgi:hypothetical protein
MGNISNQLKLLFTRYLNRLEDEKRERSSSVHSFSSSLSNSRPPSYMGACRNNVDLDDFSGIIYFYEWSDINRSPKSFYTLKLFVKFLESCGIYVPSYQLELIKNISTPHITCRKGTKDIIITCNWSSLKEEMGLDDKVDNPFHSTGSPFYTPPNLNKDKKDEEPYNVQITRINNVYPSSQIQKPNLIFEPHGKLKEFEEVNSWFG